MVTVPASDELSRALCRNHQVKSPLVRLGRKDTIGFGIVPWLLLGGFRAGPGVHRRRHHDASQPHMATDDKYASSGPLPARCNAEGTCEGVSPSESKAMTLVGSGVEVWCNSSRGLVYFQTPYTSNLHDHHGSRDSHKLLAQELPRCLGYCKLVIPSITDKNPRCPSRNCRGWLIGSQVVVG